jgi:Amt family ammonium transporter
MGALLVGGIAGGLFVYTFTLFQNKFPRIDDVLGVWPLHGLCGVWGGIAVGIFGLEMFGGMGGVTFMSQLIGSLTGILVALIGGFVVYGGVGLVSNLRLSQEEEYMGADLAIHKIASNSED